MRIVAISISKEKGTKKKNIDKAQLKVDHGIVGDAHAANWHRQLSLLAIESIHKMMEKIPTLHPGDFAENITTEGVDLLSLPIGSKIQIGEEVTLEITQHGKECHQRCEIFHQVGDCVMPREGIFAKVVKEGTIKVNDAIKILRS